MSYDFPCVTFDFESRQEIVHPSMREVEGFIQAELMSKGIDDVERGLANVLFWGFAATSCRFRTHRIEQFRTGVTVQQLARAQQLFGRIHGPAVREIGALGMPQYSHLSFVSKIRMFLDPASYVVLDRQLLKVHRTQVRTLLHEIKAYPTAIPITRHNERVYAQWCALCKRTAEEQFASAYRAADVERGIFHLIRSGRLEEAASIVRDA